jgi:hypothetical protein
MLFYTNIKIFFRALIDIVKSKPDKSLVFTTAAIELIKSEYWYQLDKFKDIFLLFAERLSINSDDDIIKALSLE